MPDKHEHILEKTIRERFGGLLRRGSHEPDGEACLLEAAHAAKGDGWSDDPNGWPDLRTLNDAPWSSDESRTEHLVPVLVRYWDCDDWPDDQYQKVIERVVIATVREIVAELPGLSDEVRAECRAVNDIAAARAAAYAARASAAAYAAAARASAAASAASAAYAASASAYAAAYAAYADAASADAILIRTCALWIHAADEVLGGTGVGRCLTSTTSAP